MTNDKDSTFRRDRALVTSDYHCSYLLEVFELGDGARSGPPRGPIAHGPIDTGPRHAVWLHHLKVGGYRWECSCGAQRDHHVLDAALVAEARAHFDQHWEQIARQLASEMK